VFEVYIVLVQELGYLGYLRGFCFVGLEGLAQGFVLFWVQVGLRGQELEGGGQGRRAGLGGCVFLEAWQEGLTDGLVLEVFL
jgi:hypothetical protein